MATSVEYLGRDGAEQLVATVKNLLADKADTDYVEEIIDSMREVPTCTTADNGKILRVVNGSAAWASIPNAEGASF